jgi:serine/threonine protein kinase
MWAFGVVLYAMITRAMPFPDDLPWDEFVECVTAADYDEEPLLDVAASPELRDLIGGLMQPDPAVRWNAVQVALHPFFEQERDAVAGYKGRIGGIAQALADGLGIV